MNSYLEQLPFEVFSNIEENLSFEDLISLSQTSTDFRKKIVQDNVLWRKLFMKKFPVCFDDQENGPNSFNVDCDWFNIYQKRVGCYKKCKKLLSAFEAKYTAREYIDDVELELNLIEFEDCFQIDSLREIVREPDVNDNLTIKYYGMKVLRHTVQKNLEQQLKQLIDNLKEGHEDTVGKSQTLEKYLVIIAKWFQPSEYISERQLFQKLEDIVKNVAQHLIESHPNHPFKQHFQYLGQAIGWKELKNVCANEKDCFTVLDSLNHIFFKQLGFTNQVNVDCVEAFCVDKVLSRKSGSAVMMSFLYVIIAKRLGIHLSIPHRFLIMLRRYNCEGDEKNLLMIDVCKDGVRRTLQETNSVYQIDLTESHVREIPPLKLMHLFLKDVYLALCRNDDFSQVQASYYVLLLEQVLVPSDKIHSDLESIYVQFGFNLDKVEIVSPDSFINGIAETVAVHYKRRKEMAEEFKRKKYRKILMDAHPNSEKGKYAVGMTAMHKKYGYQCVIYGWDEVCKAEPMWQKRMRIKSLEDKSNQPFYNVLVSDGSCRYAAEENLTPFQCQVTHRDIGRYFKQYLPNNRYVANDTLNSRFPDDEMHIFNLDIMEQN